MFQRTKEWARRLKRDILALWIAAHDSRTPLIAKIVAAAVAAYALSPIDLIPDFVPVLGYLDDLVILPLGILLAVRLIPAELMEEYRVRASSTTTKPTSWIAAGALVMIWIGVVYTIWHLVQTSE